jgi:hypothetical protein
MNAPLSIRISLFATALALCSCTRTPLIPQKLSGVYFSESGDAIAIQPGGSINIIPSSNSPLGSSSAPSFYSVEVTLGENGETALLIPNSEIGPLAGSSIKIDSQGETASLSQKTPPLSILFSR